MLTLGIVPLGKALKFCFFSQMLNYYLKHYEKKHYEILFNIFRHIGSFFVFHLKAIKENFLNPIREACFEIKYRKCILKMCKQACIIKCGVQKIN